MAQPGRHNSARLLGLAALLEAEGREGAGLHFPPAAARVRAPGSAGDDV